MVHKNAEKRECRLPDYNDYNLLNQGTIWHDFVQPIPGVRLVEEQREKRRAYKKRREGDRGVKISRDAVFYFLVPGPSPPNTRNRLDFVMLYLSQSNFKRDRG